jgi:hypothetical protein
MMLSYPILNHRRARLGGRVGCTLPFAGTLAMPGMTIVEKG